MGLLRADLHSLANVLQQRPARRLLVGHLVALSTLAALSLLFGEATLSNPQIWVLARGTAVSARSLLATALMPCALVTGWLGLGLAQRLLFEAPELALWRSSPLGPVRGAVQVLLRVLFVTLLWAAAMVVPFASLVLRQAGASSLAYVLLPPAMLLVVLPLLCPLMAVQLVLQRFFAGPLLQLLFTVLTALGSLLFYLFVLVGVLAPSRAPVAQFGDLAAAHPGLPWNVDAAAQLLLTFAGNPADATRLLSALAWALGTVLLLLLLAPLHPRAVEAHNRAHRPLFRRKNGRSWPVGTAASIRKKELAQLLQQPSQLFGMLMFGVMVFVLANQGFVTGILRTDGLPESLGQCTAMLALWFMAVLLVLGAHMGRIALWDGAQWPLYLAAPVRPRTILLGKLQAIALLLTWPVLVVTLCGTTLLHAGPRAVLMFVPMALIGNVIALGVTAVVGTLPRVIRPDGHGQIEQGSRSLLAAMLLIVGFIVVAMVPGHMFWLWLQGLARDRGLDEAEVMAMVPGVMLATLVYGGLVGGLGLWLGSRNFARLLRPG